MSDSLQLETVFVTPQRCEAFFQDPHDLFLPVNEIPAHVAMSTRDEVLTTLIHLEDPGRMDAFQQRVVLVDPAGAKSHEMRRVPPI
ncbi:hypothetical protein HDU98_005708, partial [Podochytrium sp. JEL0797]